MNSIKSEKKNINRKETLNQGKLLEDLCLKSGKQFQEVAFHLGITYQWLNRLFKKPVLPKKVEKKAIVIFQLPDDFFQTGKLNTTASSVNESSPVYGSISPEILTLKQKIQEKDEMIIQLQKEVIRLLNEIQRK